MDDRCLERNELACFGVSYFDCEVRRHERKTDNLTAEYIEVTVCMSDSKIPLMVRQLPVNMSFREIKRKVALHILEEIAEIEGVVGKFYRDNEEH